MEQQAPAKSKGADRRVLLLAIAMGIAAAVLAVLFLHNQRQETTAAEPPPPPTAPVVVAIEDIGAGIEITNSMVEVRELPEEAVWANAASSASDVVGRTLRYPIGSGEQVSTSRLVDGGGGEALSFQIPEGMRGVTMPVSTSESPASLLAPGDFIDILVTGRASVFDLESPPTPTPTPVPSPTPSPTPEPEPDVDRDHDAVVTLLQNVQVLAVQRSFVAGGTPYEPATRGDPPADGSVSYITMALTPEQAQLLRLAAEEGRLTFTLRGFGDEETPDLGPNVRPVLPDWLEGSTWDEEAVNGG